MALVTDLLEVEGATTGLSDNLQTVRQLGFQFDFSATNVPNGDTAQLIQLPAQYMLYGGYARIDVLGSASATGTLGDGADPNGLHTALALDSAIGTPFSFDGAYVAAISGKYYHTPDTIDIVVGGANLILGKLTVVLMGQLCTTLL